MLDTNELVLDTSHGERLPRAEYHRDFGRWYAAADGLDSWKFERRQHFEEQDDPSRDALRRGDWYEALRLLAEEQKELSQKAADADGQAGTVFHRVRVVEEPISPYLQWELHALRAQAASGKRIRVVDSGRVRMLEHPGLLPEVVVLGGQVLYEIVYTDAGIPDGAVRFTDAATVEKWTAFIRALYSEGQDVLSYFDDHVAHLPPPPAA